MPIQITSVPEITDHSIFSSSEVYSTDDLEEIVKFAKIRGIRIIPGIETPSHCASYTNSTNYTKYRTNCFHNES